MQTWYVWGPISLLGLLVVGFLGWELWRTNRPKRQANRTQNAAPIPGGPNAPAAGSVPPVIEKGWHPDGQHHNNKERIYWARTLRLTAAVAVGAFVSAFFSYYAAKQARYQVEASREANRMNSESGRAWLAPTRVSFSEPMVADQPIAVTLSYFNPGHEAALHVANRLALYAMKMPSSLGNWGTFDNPIVNWCSEATDAKTGRVSFPTADREEIHDMIDTSNNGIATFVTNANDRQLNRDEVAREVLAGSYVLMLQGCIAYNTSARRRTTEYCYFLQPSVNKPSAQWQWDSCNNGNDAN